MPGRPAFCLALVLASMACQASGKREASALDDAVDRYRRAEGPQKASELEAVTRCPCVNADVCAAKETCLAAIRPTLRAVALKDEVAQAVLDLQARRLATDGAAAQALPGKLDEATLLLQQGRTKMADCEKMLADLRLHYGQ